MGFLSCWSFLWDIIRNDKHLSTVIETEGCPRIETRICDLPDDLLLRILYYVKTKDAVATSILSKRWRYVWTMQLHKAPKLYSLFVDVEVGPHVPVDVNVVKLVENAVNRGLEVLDLKLLWTAQPTSFPKCLYTCDTLVDLALSNEILVDVSSPAFLPSLLYLRLHDVVYKDDESLVRLLSSSPVLKWLSVSRHEDDNLTDFTVKVSSLETLFYTTNWRKNDFHVDEVEEDQAVDDDYLILRSLVIDSPALKKLSLNHAWEEYLLLYNMPCLEVASFSDVHNPDDKFLQTLSFLIHLDLLLTETMVACCNAIKFSRLTEINFYPDNSVDWLEPLMSLLQNSPKLKSLTIETCIEGLPPSWNQPSSIPECLSSHLEIFFWRGYGGRGDERQLVTYILANSKCLNRVEISFIVTCNPKDTQKELESMPRISTSSRLVFPT